jgi:predicted RNA-binding Zn-ribbon protein involved in translation (DUF1610 family)
MVRTREPDDSELLADLEQMAEAAETEDDDDPETVDDEGYEWPDGVELDEAAVAPPPMGNRKIWIVIAVIFVAIAVAVLWVYQAGDSKTVLGNQPIPAGGATTAAVNTPGVGPLPGAAAPFGDGAPQLGAQCPNCGETGLPMCSRCNTVMQPLDQPAGLYVCPSCGVAGMPICPRCGGHMASHLGAGWR